MTFVDPYDELPYKCLPIEWTAPERLALTSFLHGGPRPRLDHYRVLELGCGNGANLLPQAFYRRQATFVGVDGARTQIEIANRAKSELNLSNLEFVHADFLEADAHLSGLFDFIVAHGIVSWVADDVRDAILSLCAKRLRHGGLVYLNYNANPGWKIRGMVREFLLAHTADLGGLSVRAAAARDVAARVVSSLPDGDHPYTTLIANEFRLVSDSDISYVAHEYLTADNHPYWRHEFMALTAAQGLGFVADADFNYSSNRLPEGLGSRLANEHIVGKSIDQTVDLLCYRQLHSPILAARPLTRRLPDRDEVASLFVAACLTPCETDVAETPLYQHPSGYRIEMKDAAVQRGFDDLQRLWPCGRPIETVFPVLDGVLDDLKLLHRHRLVELRCVEPCVGDLDSRPLMRLETLRNGYFTTPYHEVVAAEGMA